MAVSARSFRLARGAPSGIIVAGGLCAVALAGIVAARVLTGVSIPSCGFGRVTGLPCGTCGGTRAVIALGSGRPLEAVLFNPLVAVLTVGSVVWLAAAMVDRRLLGVPAALAHSMKFWAAAGAVFAANWAYLLIVGIPGG